MPPNDDALPDRVPAAAPVAVASRAQAAQPPGVWRWLARAALSLWWVFVVAFAAGAASYAGNHSGPAIVSLLPRLLTWARVQPLAVRAALALGTLLLLAAMAWLTVLAWRQRQQQATEAAEAAVERQTAAFQGALDRDVNPRLDDIQAGMRRAEAQGEEIRQGMDGLTRRAEHASVTRFVFISSTYVDLHAYRARLHEALEGLYQLPVDMVNFGAGGGDATAVSRDEVAASNLFVLVVAWRYGVVPAGQSKSITEQEYDEARRLGLPIFVFLADPATEADDGPDALFPAAVRNPAQAGQLAAFRALLTDSDRHTFAKFTTSDDLTSKVVIALTRYLLRTGGGLMLGALPAPPFDLTALPAPPVFIGREDGLAWLLGRLREGGTTGITALGGLGGIGKTALAAVAARVLYHEGRFKDGIVAVSCLGQADPAAVLLAVLNALGATPPDDTTDLPALAHVLHQRLHGKDVLIVLDNVEPELKPLTAVTIPLREAGATLLVTARQALPADVLAAGDTLKLDVLPPDEALLLFATTYLGAGKTADDLGPADRAAAEAIVRTLALHTLAVKLAAAYAREAGRALPSLAGELAADPLRVPGEDAARAVELVFRQSTDRLPAEARRLFAALACFATNEFGRRAALALAAGLDTPDPEAALDLPVKRALLDPQVAAELPAEADRERLRLHPLLGKLASGLLDDPTRAAASLAIARFYAEYANDTPDAALAPDAENIAGSLEWAHEHAPDTDRDALVAEICDDMREFWRDRSRVRESLRYLPWGITAAEAEGTRTGDARAKRQAANVRFNYGQVLRGTGRLDEAERIFIEELAYRREVEDRRGEGIVLSDLGQIALLRGRLEEAEGYSKQAFVVDREVRARREEGVAVSNLGQIALLRGRLEEAEGYFQQALELARELGLRSHEGVYLSTLGQIALRRGRLAEAEGYVQQSLAIRREVQDRRGEGVDLAQLGLIARDTGNLDDAERYFREALSLMRDVQDALNEGRISQILGEFLILHRGNRDEGCALISRAVSIFHRMGVPDEQDARELAAELGCDVGE